VKVAYWKLYLSVPISDGHAYVTISNAEAKRLRKRFDDDGKRGLMPISTGTEAGETPLTLAVNLDQVVALEAIAS
jgi:hypothetical protein